MALVVLLSLVAVPSGSLVGGMASKASHRSSSLIALVVLPVLSLVAVLSGSLVGDEASAVSDASDASASSPLYARVSLGRLAMPSLSRAISIFARNRLTSNRLLNFFSKTGEYQK